MTTSSTTTDTHAKLWELIKDIKFGMFTHRHPDGRLHSHPLTTQNQSIDENATLYFFVSRSGELAQRILTDGNVNIAYAHPGSDRYVSIAGRARAVDNPATVERLWNKMNEAWFKGGPSDPDLQLVQVQIQDAEYWNVTDSKMVQLYKMMKAAMGGEQPGDMGEHETLKMG